MKQLICKIIENKKITPSFYSMRVESSYLAKNAKPGQFVEVKCSEDSGPLLRRPLSVHEISGNGIALLYEVVGKGTDLLSRKKNGEHIDIIGPLGSGFTTSADKRPAILVAGGIGVAPLLILAQNLTAGKRIASYVIIGARTKSGLLCEKEFKKMGCFVMVATEDGSRGRKGFAAHILEHLIKIISCQTSGIYACGPHPMLKATAHIAHLANVPCQVSLEERMACGVGVCLGCPVRVKGNKYKMVCKDGPVFDTKEIVW